MSKLILHGATAQPQTLAQAAVFDTLTNVRQPLVQMFWSTQQGYRADNTPLFTNFPIAMADGLRKRGQLYLHTWSLYDWVNGAAWLPSEILAGKYDGYLHQQARTLKAFGDAIFIRMDHEMNGNWSTFWKSPEHEPKDFVNVWHYVVTLFRSEGANNVTWVWCPNEVDPVGSSASTAADKLEAWMPDPADFNWTGFDSYNWGGLQWRSLQQLADLTYNTIMKLVPNKPMMLAETASSIGGGDRNRWINDTLDKLPTLYPNVAAINYYNVDGPQNWPINQKDGSMTAWVSGLARGPYVKPGFVMPPPMQPMIVPQTIGAWGDPLDAVNAQLALTQQQLVAANAATATANAATAAVQQDLDTVKNTIRAFYMTDAILRNLP